jgi:hypothetical protein
MSQQKLFHAAVILRMCEKFLVADDLQFGFKSRVGCISAIFALKTAVKHLSNDVSSV